VDYDRMILKCIQCKRHYYEIDIVASLMNFRATLTSIHLTTRSPLIKDDTLGFLLLNELYLVTN
jgi:hypothetical protein